MLREVKGLWWLPTVLALACGGADDDTASPAPDPTPTSAPVSATPTAIPNHRPQVALISAKQEGTRVWVKFRVEDVDGDRVSSRVLWSADGSLFATCTLANGSDNILDVESGTVVTFLWDYAADISATTVVQVRVIPNDGEQDGEPAQTSEGVLVEIATPTLTPEATPTPETPTLPSPTPTDETASPTPGDPSVTPGEETSGTESPGGSETPFQPPTAVPHADLSEVGGYEDVEISGKAGLVNLNPDGDMDNIGQEFMLILMDVGEKEVSYLLGQSGDGLFTPTPEATATPDTAPVRLPEESPKDTASWTRLFPAVPSGEKTSADLEPGQTQQTFWVLNDIKKELYKPVRGTLAVAGGSVNIFVDQDIPIDWDYDCDGKIEPNQGEEFDRLGRETYGFDNCDLAQLGVTFSDNIQVHLHEFFGEESDVNSDGAITVLLSPVLNNLPSTDEDTSNDSGITEVFAAPDVDLGEYDPLENPGSNEQEMIYLPAPDPGGLFNPEAGGGGEESLDQYLTLTMGASLARALELYISYNQHVLLNEAEAEEEWLDRALGHVAADLCGFGAPMYERSFETLAAPHLRHMLEEEDEPDGMAYLYVRYLVDRFGFDILTEFMDGTEVGTDNVDAAISSQESTSDLKSTLLDYATTLLLSGARKADGSSLLDPEAIPPFHTATTIPVSGQGSYPGAGGFQVGININGDNYARTLIDGELETTGVYRLTGVDPAHYSPGIAYGAKMAGFGSFHGVRLGGLIQERSYIKFATSGDIIARVVRLPDAPSTGRSFIVEQIFGARTATAMELELRTDGWPSVALGDIDPAETLLLADTSQERSVKDTDLYEVDLSKWSSSTASLEIRANRRMDKDGAPPLKDIFVLVAPRDDVPDAESIQGTYGCGGVTSVDYPTSWLYYLTDQAVLSNSITSPTGMSTSTAYGSETCDFDEDGIADQKEPRPVSILSQINYWQESQLGGSSVYPGIFYPFGEVYTRFVDIDSQDSDEDPYADPELGIHTMNVVAEKEGESTEEAYLKVTLPASRPSNRYLIIVGASAAEESAQKTNLTGPYELIVRVVDEP